MIKNNLHHFKKNTLGQDYVVGDIHGCFVSLQELLNKIGFDPIVDRLFSVGDLCDRGPHSTEIETWLDYPWFHPALGNHEEIILLHDTKRINDNNLRNVGAAWWFSVSKKAKTNIINRYKNLPIAIEVETKNGLIGIVHAECPHADWSQLPSILNSAVNSRAVGICLWSTQSIYHKEIIKNVKAIFVGHVTQDQYTLNGNVYLIDTGAGYEGGSLTIFNINTFEHFMHKC